MERGRRTFLGSAAALGAGSVLGFGSLPATAEGPSDDPILTHVMNEAARIARAFGAQPRTDEYRALAINNRLFATHVRSRKLDARLKDHMERIVRQQGRQRVIDRAMGPETGDHRRHLLGDLGVVVSSETVAADVYQRQLDLILRKGGLAENLESTAAALDAMFTRSAKGAAIFAGHLRRVQTTEEQFRCAYLRSICDTWSASASMLCVGAYWGAFLNPLCMASAASAAGYCGAASYYGCF